MLEFQSRGHLTLGVELELQLINRETLDLHPVAPTLLERLDGYDKIKPESFQSLLEINTGVCADAKQAEGDLAESIVILQREAETLDTALATTGTHPFARYANRLPYPNSRSLQLIDRNQWISRRMIICGLHVHLGMKDGDSCVQFNNFFLNFVPHLIALTASSPFWQGENTGLVSCRSTIFESNPTAGHPCRTQDWKEFQQLCNKLTKAGAIKSHKDLWWDIRPVPNFGTLEIRVCDGLSNLQETMAIVAFIHALAHWFDEHAAAFAQVSPPHMWVMRENKWRGMRHGLEADIITDHDAIVAPMRDELELWIKRLKPYITGLGYERYFATLADIIERGTSTNRQLNIFEETGSLDQVVRHNISEFSAGAPTYQ